MDERTKNALVIAVAAMLILVVMNRACGIGRSETAATPTPRPVSQEPTDEQLEAAEDEMAGWAEGRWSEYSVRWNAPTRTVALRVTADSAANRVAIEAYCDIMADIAHTRLSRSDFSASVIQSGRVIAC